MVEEGNRLLGEKKCAALENMWGARGQRGQRNSDQKNRHTPNLSLEQGRKARGTNSED